MSIKIVFFGYRQSGKTKLIKRMFNPEVPKNFRPMPTPGLVVDQITSLQIPLEIWDLSGEERYLPHRWQYFENADMAVYCVDLSDEVDNYLIDKDIQQFRERNLKAPLVLIGTKADRVPNPKERLASIRKNAQLNESFYLSALNDLELAAFLEGLIIQAKACLYKKVKKMDLIKLCNFQIDLFEQAKNYLPVKSILYEAIDNFMEAVQHLPKQKYCALGRETFLLVDNLQNDQSEAVRHIETFIEKSNSILNHEKYYLANAVLALSAAIVITLLVATIGFGIGFAFGLWSGPLAFLSGIATSYAAISILAISGGAGLISGLMTAYGLFTERKPKIQFLEEVADAAAIPMPEI